MHFPVASVAARLVGALAVAASMSSALLVATASSVSAPEPAYLNGSLYTNGSSAAATYTISQTKTDGYQWTSTWVLGSLPAGAPCATSQVPAGTTLYSTIRASGSYRKCM
jgi:hypothetical protein